MCFWAGTLSMPVVDKYDKTTNKQIIYWIIQIKRFIRNYSIRNKTSESIFKWDL